jgi:hypothetical protein
MYGLAMESSLGGLPMMASPAVWNGFGAMTVLAATTRSAFHCGRVLAVRSQYECTCAENKSFGWRSAC